MIRASGCAFGQAAMLLRFKHSIQDDPVRASPMVANALAGTEKSIPTSDGSHRGAAQGRRTGFDGGATAWGVRTRARA